MEPTITADDQIVPITMAATMATALVAMHAPMAMEIHRHTTGTMSRSTKMERATPTKATSKIMVRT